MIYPPWFVSSAIEFKFSGYAIFFNGNVFCEVAHIIKRNFAASTLEMLNKSTKFCLENLIARFCNVDYPITTQMTYVLSPNLASGKILRISVPFKVCLSR